MDMTEYVKQILREEGITQSELARRVKWSTTDEYLIF